jgi:hypothetical protein
VIQATEKTMRAPEFAELAAAELAAGESDRIGSALEALKAVLNGPDRDAIQQNTHALNDATKHLAEIVMNRSVQAALSGRNIDQL